MKVPEKVKINGLPCWIAMLEHKDTITKDTFFQPAGNTVDHQCWKPTMCIGESPGTHTNFVYMIKSSEPFSVNF